VLQLLGLPHRLHIGLLACICVTDATLLSMWRTISRPKPQQPFHQRTYRQTGRDIAGPMRQQDDPGRDQSRPDRPDYVLREQARWRPRRGRRREWRGRRERHRGDTK